MKDAELLLPVIEVSYAVRDAFDGSVVAVCKRACLRCGETTSILATSCE